MDTYTPRELRLITLHKLRPEMKIWIWGTAAYDIEAKFEWININHAFENIKSVVESIHRSIELNSESRRYILDLSFSGPPKWVPPVTYDYDLQ